MLLGVVLQGLIRAILGWLTAFITVTAFSIDNRFTGFGCWIRMRILAKSRKPKCHGKGDR